MKRAGTMNAGANNLDKIQSNENNANRLGNVERDIKIYCARAAELQ